MTNTDITTCYIGNVVPEKLLLGSEVVWSATKPDPVLEEYLTFKIVGTSQAAQSRLYFYSSGTTSGSPTVAVYYSKNSGETWTRLGKSLAVASGDTIWLKGDNPTYASGQSDGQYHHFYTQCNLEVRGNIMSLIDSTNFATLKELSSAYTFCHLFEGCNIRNFRYLRLPATALTNYCYAHMFKDVTVPTHTFKLPEGELNLASGCFSYMFRGCKNLGKYDRNYIELPSTTLKSSCYRGMFLGCTNLTKAPELPAAVVPTYAYQNMFASCSSLAEIKCLATDISASACTTGWVNGVAATGTFTKNPNMTGWTTGVDGIPTGWTVENA